MQSVKFKIINFTRMLRQVRKLIFFVIILLISTVSYSQTVFIGGLHYALSYSGNGMEEMAEILTRNIRVLSDGSNLRIDLIGGMAAINYGYFIVDGKNNDLYVVNDAQKKTWKLLKNKPIKTYDIPIITDTKVDEKINGLICRKYRTDATIDEVNTTTYLWINRSLILPTLTPELNLLIGNLISLEGVHGTIVKQIILSDGASTSITLDKVDKSTPDQNLFQLPANYSLSERDFDSFTNGF